MANKITTITSKGTAAPAMTRSGVPTSHLGTFDPATGRVWQHPRLTLNPLKGSSVKVTNPKASSPQMDTLTRSIGMGGAGQQLRNR